MNPSIAVLAIAAVVNVVFTAQLHAQSLLFTNRNGTMTAYCGPIGSGPSELHRYSVPEPTEDAVVVSEPGAEKWPASGATCQLEVMTSSTNITISESGNGHRGGLRPLIDFGVYSVAAASDFWEFDLKAPARFIFNARWNSASTAIGGVSGGYSFSGAGIRADPGSSADAMSGGFSDSGAIDRRAQGRLLPGRYAFGMNFRVDGVDTYPFTGFFIGAMTVELRPDAPAITKTQAGPQGLEIEWSDLGPKFYTVEVSSSLTGGDWTPVVGVAWPISAHSISLPAPTTFPSFYRVKVEP